MYVYTIGRRPYSTLINYYIEQVYLSTRATGRLAIAFGRKAHFPGGVIHVGHITN